MRPMAVCVYNYSLKRRHLGMPRNENRTRSHCVSVLGKWFWSSSRGRRGHKNGVAVPRPGVLMAEVFQAPAPHGC